jgi:hypothetical protein
MKPLLLLIFILAWQLSPAQVIFDSSIRKQYWTLFEQLPGKVKDKKDEQFRDGLGILIRVQTDTLNKQDFASADTSLQGFVFNKQTGEKEPLVADPTEEDLVSKEQPAWLSAGCRFKYDSLQIAAGISLFSGFVIITSIRGDKAKAVYSEYETQGLPFKTLPAGKKLSEFTIAATLDSITLDRKPKKGIKEIYGKISVTTDGFYTSINAFGFKNGYIFKRKKYEYYFRCTIPKGR